MTQMLDRLATLGAPYRDPVEAIDWQASDDEQPWLPLSMLSVDGLPLRDQLSEETLRRLSRAEFSRLCVAGMWLEGLLISRVTERGFVGARVDEARVMLQEVREETGHSLMFLEMVDRAGLADVPLLGDTKLLTRVAHHLNPDGPEFWSMVYIGETVTDTFATQALKAVRKCGEAICPVARQVLDLHHHDEARHIAAARVFLANRAELMTRPRRMIFARTLRFLLKRFLAATLYPTVESLAVAGVPDPQNAAAAVRACPQRRRLAEACAAPALGLLGRGGLIETARTRRKESA